MMLKSWQLVPLGEVLTERRETPSSEKIETGEISIISKIGFNSGELQLRNEVKTNTGMILIRPGDLVVSGINASKGAIAIYSETSQKLIAATIHYGVYIPNRERVNLKYLWWFLRSSIFKDIVQQYIPGGIKTELRAKRLLNIRIPLPDLVEQNRILKQIEEISLFISNAQIIRKESIIETKTLQSRAFDDILLKGNYQIQTLKDVLSEPLVNGLSIPASAIGKEGILFAKVGIVNSGKMNSIETKRVNITLPENSNFWMKSGDIFVSRGNSLELVGRAAVYEGKPENCAFPDLLIRIRVNKMIVEPSYLVYFFQSAKARNYIESEASGTSPSMKKVSQPKLERMFIPIPPLEEQRKLVQHLDKLKKKISTLISLQTETQKEMDALMPSILAKAFKGKF